IVLASSMRRTTPSPSGSYSCALPTDELNTLPSAQRIGVELQAPEGGRAAADRRGLSVITEGPATFQRPVGRPGAISALCRPARRLDQLLQLGGWQVCGAAKGQDVLGEVGVLARAKRVPGKRIDSGNRRGENLQRLLRRSSFFERRELSEGTLKNITHTRDG